MRYQFMLLGALAWLAWMSGCGNEPQASTSDKPAEAVAPLEALPFSADSAYAYIERQVAFGPRVPNTAAHAACGAWIMDQFRQFGGKVQAQRASVQAHTGEILEASNIIASFQPEKVRRIMLTAHWDTRPRADMDPDPSRQNEPILGANDAGSGVGVLLEIARQMQQKAPEIGVDIILWDAEDYGDPGVQNSYCLGSQHWAANKHQPGYQPLYAINLDMVGAADAYFPREGQSMTYARNVVDKVWGMARRLGHGNHFSMQRTDPIIDDHYYISQIGGIKAIDIIDQPGGSGFFGGWHTHADNMEVISRETLQAVGETMMGVVYSQN